MNSVETREKPVLATMVPEIPPPARGFGHWMLSVPRGTWRPTRTVVLAAVLLLLAAALIAIILDEMAPPLPLGDSVAEPPPRAAAAPAVVAGLKPLANYAETVARPLFSPIRRAPAPAASAAALGQVSALVLSGIVVNHNERHALIQRGRSGVPLRVAEGDVIDGWTVRSVMRDGIVLQHGATEHELLLRDNEKPGR